jgi:hypothetical protein
MYKHGIHLYLTDLQEAGNTLGGDFHLGAPLPNDAQILGTRIITVTAFTGPDLTSATAKIGLAADQPSQYTVIGDLTTEGTYTSGGQQFQVSITLTGCLMNALTAGEMYAVVYYTRFTQLNLPLPIVD